MSAATLSERAAQLARAEVDESTVIADQVSLPSRPVVEPLPDLGIPEPGPEGPELVSVRVAWRRVRQTVGAIGKNDLYNASGTKYNFRGADRVINAFGPATLLHGVDVIPIKTEATFNDTRSSKGTHMRECCVTVTWQITGPMEDSFIAQSVGQATDYADKAASKAQTVALRVLLLGAGLIPTNEPDPDESYVERGDPSAPTAQAYLAEVTNPLTPRERMRQIYNELMQHRLLTSVVEHQGQRLELGQLLLGISEQRWPKAKPKPASPEHNGHPEDEWMDGCEGCIAESRDADQRAAGGDA